jgi:hypothetical protein
MRNILALLLQFSMQLGCVSSTPMKNISEGEIYNPPQGAVVLRVQVLEVEFTDLNPGCGDENDCIPFYFWHKYRARVTEVFSGDWKQPEVKFNHLQHAQYIDKVTRDCYVVLRPAGGDLLSKSGVPFVAVKLLSRFWEHDRILIKALRDGT